LVLPPSGQLREPAARSDDDRDGGTTLDFPDGAARELFFTLPSLLAPAGRELCLTVQRTANLAVEALAIVPLADELPPPPPQPWEASPLTPVEAPPRTTTNATH
jgi:hypothetical protein